MNHGYAMWPLAILMIVVTSWLLYRYVAPESWREWQGAGLVQAFLIALYAEMYGFPLTIYMLSGFFGLEIPLLHQSGHLWATLLGYGPVGGVIEMTLGYGLIFLGLGLLIEGWRELYRAREEDRLATDGLYGLVRHPQYVGIVLALLGQLIHWPTLPTLVLFPVIVVVYLRLARREEQLQASGSLGKQYQTYRQDVPRFIPRRDHWSLVLQTIWPGRRKISG